MRSHSNYVGSVCTCMCVLPMIFCQSNSSSTCSYFIQCHSACGVSLIAGVEYGEWKMEWNSEHTQLELTHATGNVQSVEHPVHL